MTIQELADRAEVTTRTIRYYVEQGVLPPPGYGRPAEYTEEHVERLALIKRLKEQYLPLEEIRDTLQRLSLAEVEQLLMEHSPATQEVAQQQKLDSAADYIAGVFGRGVAREQMKRRIPTVDGGRWTVEENEGAVPFGRAPLPPPAPAAPGSSPPAAVAPGGAMAQPEQLPGVGRSSVGKTVTAEPDATYIPSPAQEMDGEPSSFVPRPSSSQWERVNLGEGVELHYPTQADVHTRGRVARLIEAARHILGKDPGNGE